MSEDTKGNPARQKNKDDEVLTFYGDRQEKKIRLAFHAEGKEPEDLILRTMDGVEISAWMNFSEGRAVYNKEGAQTGVKNYDGYFERLISFCLVDPTTGDYITESNIAALPAPTKLGLYKECCRMNGLRDESAETERKN